MSGRPEEFFADYDRSCGDDTHAWEEFTPWRPGDPSTVHEGSSRQRREAGLASADELLGERRPAPARPEDGGGRSEPPVRGLFGNEHGNEHGKGAGAHGGGRARRERHDPISVTAQDQPHEPGYHRHYREGEQVRNNRAISGAVFEHVPEHTQGRVVRTETSMLGDRFSTVRFDNGHTETVRDEYLDRRGLFD